MIDQIIQRLFGRTPSGNLLRETKALAGAIPLIAQALVERRGKKIRIVRRRASGGCTDGQTIQIEDTPIPRSNSDTEAFVRFTAIQLGLVHHEVGHINYTDFTAKRSEDAFTRHLENLIEDIRQEMLHIACVHNGRSALDALDLAMNHTGPDDPVDGPDVSPEGVFACWLSRTLRFTVRSQGYLAQDVIRARAALEQRIGPQAIEAVEALIPRVATLANTTETIALASEIAAVLRQEHEQLQNQSQQSSQDQEQGQDQQNGDGSADGEGTSSQQDDQQSSQEPGQSQPKAQQDDQDQQQGSDPSPANGSPQPDPDQQNGPEQSDGQGQQDNQDQQQGSGSTPSEAEGQDDRGQQHGQDQTQGHNRQDDQDPQHSQDSASQSGPPQAGQPTPCDSSRATGTNDPQQGQGQPEAKASQLRSEQERVTAQQQAQSIAQVLQGQDMGGTGDLADQAHELLEQLSEQLRDNGAEIVAYDPEVVNAIQQPPDKHWISDNIDLEEGVGHVQRLRAVLNKHLQAQSMAKTARTTRGSRINTKALVGVPVGDARLFRKNHPAELIETAIVIAMDCSGSMSLSGNIILSDQAVYATACALETLPGCQVAVVAFPGNQMILRFGQRARKHRTSFGQAARGGTPMHESVQQASILLSQRTEPRKLLMVVTDGEADSHAHAEMALLAAERMGIETMAIGIRTAAPKRLFNQCAVITEMAQLPGAMLTMLGGRILSVRDAA